MDNTVHGNSLIGPYRLDGLLGQGGMAQVFKAWHTGLHRYEALKLLPPHLAHDRSFVERFITEARTAARLRHPHIATIYTVSEPDAPQPFFTMEMIEGRDLSDLLTQRGRLPLGECLPILKQMAEALDYAHSQGVVHRDVKPANALLHATEHGDLNVKLVDFGIARAQQDSGGTRLTKTGMIVGTPEYMSPEQAEGKPDIDYRTDIYSLGIVAYEMLCGQPPFRGGGGVSAISIIMSHLRDQPTPPTQFATDLPAGVDAAVLTALAKAPMDRFGSCTAFIDALAATLPRPKTPQPPVWNAADDAALTKPRISRAPVLVSLCLVLAACSLFAGRAWQKAQVNNLVEKTKNQAEKEGLEAKRLVNDADSRLKRLAVRKRNHTLTREQALAEIAITDPELKDAVRHARAALEQDRNNRGAWLQLARGLYYQDEFTQASDTIKQAIALFPDDNDLMPMKSLIDEKLTSPSP